MSYIQTFPLKQINRAWQDLLGIFYPRLCLSCDKLLHESEEILCHLCLSKLPFSGFGFNQSNPVYELLAKLVKIENASSLFIFHQEGIMQKLIHELKYKGQQDIGKLIAQLACETYKNNTGFSTIDYIVPVPLHKKKLKKRGYNQLSVFGENLGNCFGIRYDEKILIKKKNTESQTRKNVEERRVNVANTFEILNPPLYKSKHFLIIDDVMTTGATTEACAHTILEQIPESKVSVLTMAVVYHI